MSAPSLEGLGESSGPDGLRDPPPTVSILPILRLPPQGGWGDSPTRVGGAPQGVSGALLTLLWGPVVVGAAQEDGSAQADSHCGVEASAGRVVESSDHGVQDKSRKLKPKREGVMRFGGERRQGGGQVRCREKRRLRAPLHTPTLPLPNLQETLPRKPRK